MFAVIETGGKQYKVEKGSVLYVEKLVAEENETVKFDKVLAVSDENGFRVGAPFVEGASVDAQVVKQVKGKKIYVIKYKAKKNEKMKMGHRQLFTKVVVTNIEA